MNKTLLLVTFLEVVVIIAGSVMTYSGTGRAEVDTTGKSFSFGNYYFHDYSANKTYLEGGDFTFYDCKSDTLEVFAIHPPAPFNESRLSNVYFAVWEGGTKPNLPENKPDALIQATALPEVYQFWSRENTVSFELIANETYQNLGNSSTWTADFVRIHIFAGNAGLVTSGILLIEIGIAIILLTNCLFAKLASKTTPSPLKRAYARANIGRRRLISFALLPSFSSVSLNWRFSQMSI